MEFQLQYRDVVTMLALKHLVLDGQFTAFKGRIQHFQRLGFPPGVNTGRGRAAKYGLPEVILLALGLELIQVGMSPERAVSLLLKMKNLVPTASAKTVQEPGWLEQEAATWMAFAPSAMNAAFGPTSAVPKLKIENPWVSEEATFFFADNQGLFREIKRLGRASQPGRMALVNFSGVLRSIASFWMSTSERSVDDFITLVEDWAESASSEGVVKRAATLSSPTVLRNVSDVDDPEA